MRAGCTLQPCWNGSTIHIGGTRQSVTSALLTTKQQRNETWDSVREGGASSQAYFLRRVSMILRRAGQYARCSLESRPISDNGSPQQEQVFSDSGMSCSTISRDKSF